EAEGIDATVWDVRIVTPLDPEMLADAGRHPVVVTVEDGYREAGVGSAVAARLSEAEGSHPLMSNLGVPLRYIPHGKPAAIHAALGLDGAGVAAEVRRLLAVARDRASA